jgi:hypothetical protein
MACDSDFKENSWGGDCQDLDRIWHQVNTMKASKSHGSIVTVPKRSLTDEEEKWIREIAEANPAWADVDLGEIFVVGECSCGCRTIVFGESPFVQNPTVAGHQGPIGEMSIRIRRDDVEDVVSVLLHQTGGKLTDLEVVWYNFPEPVPKTWVEVARTIGRTWKD